MGVCQNYTAGSIAGRKAETRQPLCSWNHRLIVGRWSRAISTILDGEQTVRANKLKDALAAGRIPVGHMISEFATRGIAKIVESTGVDFVLLDMEQTGHGAGAIADLLAWFKATEVTPFVRVPQAQYHFIARVMDAGAMGVMLPNVETGEEARAIVGAVKCAPLGQRGVGLGTAHTDYVVPDPVACMEESVVRTLAGS